MAQILLIEDNLADVRLTKEAFRECSVQHTIISLKNGSSAIQYLLNQCEFEGAKLPDLILLDLNLPRRDGREVLSVIKSSGSLKDIPVVILSTSRNENDIFSLYQLRANCYITSRLS